MAFTICTSGVLVFEKRNSIVGIEAHHNLFKTENIKVVVDTRSITNYVRYDEKSFYNPLNLHLDLKAKSIEYYNFGDLFRVLGTNIKGKDKYL